MTDQIHWTKLQNVTNKPNLKMLLNEDSQKYFIYMKCLLKGERRGNGGNYHNVIFDRDYVIYWLNNFYKTFFINPNLRPFKELISLIVVSLIKYCEIDLKVYQLHGKSVIRLEDLGLTIKDVTLNKKEIDYD
jgi:hypothetical protein